MVLASKHGTKAKCRFVGTTPHRHLAALYTCFISLLHVELLAVKKHNCGLELLVFWDYCIAGFMFMFILVFKSTSVEIYRLTSCCNIASFHHMLKMAT